MNTQIIRAQVETITPLTGSIVQLILKPDVYVDYQAGQYLKILLDEEELSYSIANAPLGAHHYELHIRHSRNNPYHQRLFAHIKTHGWLNLRLPFGQCSLNHLEEKCPILFIAQGTGFAPVNAMIEQLLTIDDPRPFELFWGARSQSDLYLDEKVKNWQLHAPCFNYFSSISDESKETVTEAVLKKHLKDLKNWQIVISGPFVMVYKARDVLVQQGLESSRLFSDAFNL